MRSSTLFAIALVAPSLAAPAAAQSTMTLVSSSTTGGAAIGESLDSVISPCGRFVAYSSDATDITADADANGTDDVFLYDAQTGTTVLVSKAVDGGSGNGRSTVTSNRFVQAFSDDGRYLAFRSASTDLTTDADANGADDLYLYDRVEDSVHLVTKAVGGGAADAPTFDHGGLSADGRFLAFYSEAIDLTADADVNGSSDVFLYDRVLDTCTLVSRSQDGGAGDDRSYQARLSRDGSTVAFESSARDLTADSIFNGDQVFRWDRLTQTITLISKSAPGVAASGNSAPYNLSADGRRLVFRSTATDQTPDTDQNGDRDLFLYDAGTDAVSLISVAIGGGTGNGGSENGSLSADGRIVAFESEATDLTADTDHNGSSVNDVYVRDLEAGTTTLVSRASTGGTGDGESDRPVVSADGRRVVFESRATDLTADPDANGWTDIFLYDRSTDALLLVSRSASGTGAGNDSSATARLSRHGRYVAFDSEATDLTADAQLDGGEEDIFLFDLFGPDAVGTPYCLGDGFGAACPCDNPGGPGEGCANSSGAGARLAASGSASVGADDLSFDAAELPAGQPVLLFVGRNELAHGNGIAFGDGLRCAGGGVVRLGIRHADAQGAASWGPGLAASGGWQAGDARAFQAWYRDPLGGPCGSTFNLSNGVAVSFVD